MNKLNENSEEIKSATGDVLYSWDSITPSMYFGEVGKYIQFGVPFIVFLYLFGMEFIAFKVIPVFISFYFIICFFLVMIYRYTTFSNYKFHYEVYPSGIKVVCWKLIPSWLVKIIRFLSWISIFIVILSVVIMGPLALAGSGIFVFSLFKFRTYSADIDSWFIPFSSLTVIFYLKRNSFCGVYSYPYKDDFCGKLFINRNDKQVVLNNIKKITNCEVYEVNNVKEEENHIRKKEIINSMTSE